MSTLISRLWEVGGRQYGYFTAAQAKEVGVDAPRLKKLAIAGAVVHRRRGVYRISDAAITPQSELIEATLWAARVGAVLTAESTLALYELADVNPRCVHLAVPVGARIRSSGGEKYCLHPLALAAADRTEHLDVPTVTPRVAIGHCIALGLEVDLIDQAIQRAVAMELLGRVAAAELTVKAHNRARVTDSRG